MSYQRKIAVVRFDPGPPEGWDVTFLECGHFVWCPVWPYQPSLFCAECLHADLALAEETQKP